MKIRTLPKSPIMDQIFDLINEYYEQTAESPPIIRLSPRAYRRVVKEVGNQVNRLISMQGDHKVEITTDLRDHWIEVLDIEVKPIPKNVPFGGNPDDY